MALLKLYCPNMRYATVTAATSETTYHEKEFGADFNPNTYWQPTSTAQQDFTYSFSTSTTVTCMCLYLRNYASITAGTYSAYNDTTLLGSVNCSDTATPIRLLEFGSSSGTTFKLRISTGVTTTSKLGLIFFGVYYSLTTASEYPYDIEYDWKHREYVGESGQRHVVAASSIYQEVIERKYHIVGDPASCAVLSAWNLCQGTRYPLIINETTTQSTAKLVRFDEKPKITAIEYQFYELTVRFREVYSVPAGEYF